MIPSHIRDKKERQVLGYEKPEKMSSLDSYSTFGSTGVDNEWDMNAFKRDFRITPILNSDERLIFEMDGIDASITNAFRRIMISEVPTMCIETVYIHKNTSVIPDETLSHRLGLIPLLIDPTKFKFKEPNQKDLTEEDTLVFNLNVECKESPDKKGKFINEDVLSGSLVWEPQVDQEDIFATKPQPVIPDILIARLRPGQAIHVRCYVHKGIGKDHSKFSPVATASYRLVPHLRFLHPEKLTTELSQRIVNACPMSVFKLDEKKKVVIDNVYMCTKCRECTRDDLAEVVELSHYTSRFIMDVESVGIMPARQIFLESSEILRGKAETLIKEIEQKQTQE